MKTHAFYGFLMALSGALLMFVLYFFGFHNDPNKFLIGAGLGLLGAIAITSIGLVLGIRSVREERGPGKFSFGQAFLAGLLITIFSSVFGTITQVTYSNLINPDYMETSVQWAQSMMERANLPYDQIEAKISEMREKSAIGYQIRNSLIVGIFVGGLVSLIAAAALKRNPDNPETPAG